MGGNASVPTDCSEICMLNKKNANEGATIRGTDDTYPSDMGQLRENATTFNAAETSIELVALDSASVEIGSIIEERYGSTGLSWDQAPGNDYQASEGPTSESESLEHSALSQNDNLQELTNEIQGNPPTSGFFDGVSSIFSGIGGLGLALGGGAQAPRERAESIVSEPHR